MTEESINNKLRCSLLPANVTMTVCLRQIEMSDRSASILLHFLVKCLYIILTASRFHQFEIYITVN